MPFRFGAEIGVEGRAQVMMDKEEKSMFTDTLSTILCDDHGILRPTTTQRLRALSDQLTLTVRFLYNFIYPEKTPRTTALHLFTLSYMKNVLEAHPYYSRRLLGRTQPQPISQAPRRPPSIPPSRSTPSP